MSASIKDAKPGERWERESGDPTWPTFIGVVVDCCGLVLAVRKPTGIHCMELFDCMAHGWRKTHNADGTPYEEPAPMPDFGECWAARDEDGMVFAYESKPFIVGNFYRIKDGDFFCLGRFSFRPELPWVQTACKVRVRLDVAE